MADEQPRPVDVEAFVASGSLLLICPDCGNWVEFPPIQRVVTLSIAHAPQCQLSDVRALAEGRIPAGQATVA